MAFKNKSLYKVKPSEEEDSNLGYEYRGNMLKNMLSNKLYANSFIQGYLDKLEEAVYFLYTVSIMNQTNKNRINNK